MEREVEVEVLPGEVRAEGSEEIGCRVSDYGPVVGCNLFVLVQVGEAHGPGFFGSGFDGDIRLRRYSVDFEII